MGTTGIGIVFDIDDLGGGFYGDKAWRIFMRTLDPSAIIGGVLREGDTSETLDGRRREFCIAVFGPAVDVALVKKAFAECDDVGLAPADRRFAEGPRLVAEPLVDTGRIDAAGRLVQDEWSRVVHDQCGDSGWGFAPESAPDDLAPELKAELRELKGRTCGRTVGQNATPDPVSGGVTRRPWWKFWA